MTYSQTNTHTQTHTHTPYLAIKRILISGEPWLGPGLHNPSSGHPQGLRECRGKQEKTSQSIRLPLECDGCAEGVTFGHFCLSLQICTLPQAHISFRQSVSTPAPTIHCGTFCAVAKNTQCTRSDKSGVIRRLWHLHVPVMFTCAGAAGT